MTPKQQEALDALEKYGSQNKAAKALGLGRSTFQERISRAKRHQEADPAVKQAMSSAGMQDAGVLHSGWIKTDEASLYFKMPGGDSETVNDVADRIKDVLSDIQPAKQQKPPDHFDQDLLTVFPIADVHLGMYASSDEVGEDYDISVAENRVTNWINRAVEASPPAGTAVILDIGDFHHADTQDNRTPQSKHQLDVSGRHFEAVEAGVRTMVHCCNAALAKHSKVIVRVLPGNHNPTTYMTTLFALDAYYRNEGRVEVQKVPGEFFIMRFGSCLFAAHHGDKSKPERMVMAIADRYADDWGKTKHRFLYSGHLHHLKSSEIGGVLWMQLRAVAPKDAHAFNASYSGKSEIRATTFHKDKGEIMSVVVSDS